MPAIKTELERITGQHAEDIADGAGIYAKTNPPRVLNIAMAISGGRTLNIAKACDIFYGNDPADSQTITEAISRGVKSGSPYDSIDAILRAVSSEPRIFFEGDVTTEQDKYGQHVIYNITPTTLSEDNYSQKIIVSMNGRDIELTLANERGSNIDGPYYPAYENLPFNLSVPVDKTTYDLVWDKEESGHLVIKEA